MMKALATLATGFSLVSATPGYGSSSTNKTENGGLILDQAPDTLQPYVLRKNSGQAVSVGQQIYRFSVTGNSSAGAFTLMQTNAPDSTALGVLPHTHEVHYENFYCTKGRFQLWASTNSTGQEARVLTQGDYGAVPHDTTHTFQTTDPDTQITGVIQPGGFEELFIAIGDGPYTSSTGSEFVPAAASSTAAGNDPAAISALEAFDVYAQLAFSPRYDFVNGSAGASGSNWHDGNNSLAEDAFTPNFIAKNYGPKYLNTDDGVYRIIAPLATGEQTEGNFTMGTITMSPLLSNQTAPSAVSYSQPLAFQMQEGELVVSVDGYEGDVTLIDGDVLFVPAGTEFSYYASLSFTKFLYVSGGGSGFDYVLLQNSSSWDYAVYPIYAGFTVQ